jgi:Sulfotransferase domain
MTWNAKRSGQRKQNPGISNRDVSWENPLAANRSIAIAGGVLARVKRKLVAPRLTKSRARLPSILINTMPKSGSIYLSRMVASSLGIEFSLKPLAHGFFATYFMIPDALERFSGGDVLRQEHFDASPINLTLCGRNIDRLVLHVRDPRQAMLSWTHHVNRLLKLHPNGINFTIHQPPDDFLDWPFDDQLDWHIDRHLVSLVAWLRQWLMVDQTKSSLKILWTTYDELVNDERVLFDRILEFHQIPPDRFDFRPPEKTMQVHFRAGQPDEWQSALTAEQKKRCANTIGRDLFDHFGWRSG